MTTTKPLCRWLSSVFSFIIVFGFFGEQVWWFVLTPLKSPSTAATRRITTGTRDNCTSCCSVSTFTHIHTQTWRGKLWVCSEPFRIKACCGVFLTLQVTTTASRSRTTCVWSASTRSRTPSPWRRSVSSNAVCCVSAPVCPTPPSDSPRGNPASSSRWTGSVRNRGKTRSRSWCGSDQISFRYFT